MSIVAYNLQLAQELFCKLNNNYTPQTPKLTLFNSNPYRVKLIIEDFVCDGVYYGYAIYSSRYPILITDEFYLDLVSADKTNIVSYTVIPSVEFKQQLEFYIKNEHIPTHLKQNSFLRCEYVSW